MDELHWTETALRNLDEIGSYIALDNPGAAEDVVRRIVETVAVLAFHPRIGRANEDGQTRRLVVTGTPYIVVYRHRQRVDVLTFFHASHQWPDDFAGP